MMEYVIYDSIICRSWYNNDNFKIIRFITFRPWEWMVHGFVLAGTNKTIMKWACWQHILDLARNLLWTWMVSTLSLKIGTSTWPLKVFFQSIEQALNVVFWGSHIRLDLIIAYSYVKVKVKSERQFFHRPYCITGKTMYGSAKNPLLQKSEYPVIKSLKTMPKVQYY